MKAAAVRVSGQDSRDQLKLPHIVWSNLIFQVPQCKIPTKVTRKTRRQERNLAVASKPGFRGEDEIASEKNGERKWPPLWRGCSHDVAPQEGRVSTLAGSHDMNSPRLPASKTWVASEKPRPRKILVDLRPLLEKVTDPVESWEKKPTEKQPLEERCPSSASGGSRDEGLSEGSGKELPADFSKDRGIPRVHLFLPPIRASKLYRKRIKTSKRTLWTPPVESTQLQKTTLPAFRTFEPHLQMPHLFSKGDLRKHVPLQEERPAEPEGGPEEAPWGLPAASSTDFQLPTQLLLQKLQETTTSNSHLLIVKVLRSLREELLGGKARDSDQRENQKDFPELPWIRPWKRGKADQAFDVPDMETAKSSLIRLIENRNNVPRGTGVSELPPGL